MLSGSFRMSHTQISRTVMDSDANVHVNTKLIIKEGVKK